MLDKRSVVRPATATARLSRHSGENSAPFATLGSVLDGRSLTMVAIVCIALGVILSISSCVAMLATEDTWQGQSFAQRYGGSVVRLLLGGLLLVIGLALIDWRAAQLLLGG
jgi:hypothetical protein